MPYITPKDREKYKLYESCPAPQTPGDLNYIITTIIIKALGKSPNYEAYNSAIGVLSCCSMELYRRQIIPYENGKIKTNGDVF